MGNCITFLEQLRQLCTAQYHFSDVILPRKGSGQMGHKQTPPADWSPRITRYDPPALKEAIAAAQGLTEQIEGQIEIAAQLMGLPEDEVRPEVLKATTQTNTRPTGSTYVRQRRTEVVIERRGPRVPLR
jgi:hypothetical protein